MKMNAPSSPPAHRLPVLTEVVQLADPPEMLPAAVVDDTVRLLDVAAGPRLTPRPMPEPEPQPEPLPLVEQPAPFPFSQDAPSPPEWLKRRPTDAKVDLPLPAMAPQTPLPSDFSGSWWSRDEGPAVLPSPTPVPMPIPAPLAAHAPAVTPVSEDELVRRVLAGIDGQLDLMFDDQLRDAIVPALARAADVLMADLRGQLAATLHEMVAHAVAVEMARHGRGGGGTI